MSRKPSFMKKMLEDNAKRAEQIAKAVGESNYGYMGDPSLHWSCGGYRRDGMNLFYGPSKSGKTSLAMKYCGQEQQRKGGVVIILDSENSNSDPQAVDSKGNFTEAALKTRARLTAAGIDPDNTVIRISNDISYAFQYSNDWEKALQADPTCISAFLVDSWEGFQSQAGYNKIIKGEADAAGNQFGGNSKTINPALKFLNKLVMHYGVTVFSIQHVRANMDQYGPKWLIPGGQTFIHLHNMIMLIEASEYKKDTLLVGDVQGGASSDTAQKVGKLVRFKCDKSRACVEGRTGEMFMNFQDLQFAKPEESLFNLAVRLGVIVHPLNEKTGKPNNLWWQYPAESDTPVKMQGQAGAIKLLTEDKDLYNAIWEECRNSSVLKATTEDIGETAVIGDDGEFLSVADVIEKEEE